MSRISMLRGLGVLAALGVTACRGTDDEQDARDDDEVARSAAQVADAAVGPRRPRDAAPACTVAPGCDSVPLVFGRLEACCTQATSCGFRAIGGPPGIVDAVAEAVGLAEGETCAPRERYFIRHATLDDMRVPTKQGKDILLSASCDSASILSLTFTGCCMPNNRCGLSTYAIWDTIAVLAPSVPFAKLQCTSATELNAQVAASPFRGLRFLHDTDAPCDHAALDARLPPVE